MDSSRFLKDRDPTGRFIVTSLLTGIQYYIEPLDSGQRQSWGDVDPATKEISGSYGAKYKGSVHPTESLITKDQGFENIVELKPGVSPHAEIQRVDQLRYEEGWRPKQ